MHRMLTAVLLLGIGCGYPNEPVDRVQVYLAGTMMSGDSFVGFIQRWRKGPASEGGNYNKLSMQLVHPNGQKGPLGDPNPPGLAEDCSDHPSSLGICVAATKTVSDGADSWSYALADGSKIQIRSYGVGSISRIAGNGSTIWIRENIVQPMDAIRGSTLLVLSSDRTAVHNLEIGSGEPTWSVMAPAQL